MPFVCQTNHQIRLFIKSLWSIKRFLVHKKALVLATLHSSINTKFLLWIPITFYSLHQLVIFSTFSFIALRFIILKNILL